MAMNASVAMQRAGPLAGIQALLREFDVDPAVVFDGSGVDPSGLAADTMLAFSTATRILERAARASRCDHFGLLLGRRYEAGAHGPLLRLMRSAPTLRRALLDFIAWQPGYSSGATTYLNRIGDDFAWGYAAYDRRSPGTHHLYDIALAAGAVMLHDLTQGRVRPEEVLLSRREPADPAAYARVLGAPVRFNQGQTCIVLAGGAMQTPLATADAALNERTQRELDAMMSTAFASVAMRVTRLVRPHLLQDDPSFTSIAAAMGLHPRTLRRRLAEEGTSYETLLDEVRFTMARELLLLTDLPVGDVSAALGYAAQSAFNHAFQRWSGCSPSQWRRQALGARAGEGEGGSP